MKWWETVELALERLGGSASLGGIYPVVERIRRENHDSLPVSLQEVVRKELEYNSSDSSNWRGTRDLFFSVHGIGNGVCGLRSYLAPPPFAADISDGEEEPGRAEQLVYRIIRDTVMSRKIKALHNFECQICGATIDLGSGTKYAEAHHIVPLGTPYNGADIPSNIIVVCPNHHAMLDFGAIPIELGKLKTAHGHVIDPRSAAYHNTNILTSVPEKITCA